MDELNLLPCPFCGGTKLKLEKKSKFDRHSIFAGQVKQQTFYVRCNTCYAKGGAVSGKVTLLPILKYDVGAVDVELLKKQAVKAWNRRADNG